MFLYEYSCNLVVIADTVTAVEFDEDGSHLATGDRGGRVVLFKSTGTTKMV